MRHVIHLFILVLATITPCACNDHKAIKKAAYNYSFFMANYQVDEAAKYATDETIETTINYAYRIVKIIDTAYIISDTPAEITITKVEQTSDTTAFAIYHKVTPIKDFSDTLQLRKREGQWLAHAPIQTAPQRANNPFTQAPSLE